MPLTSIDKHLSGLPYGPGTLLNRALMEERTATL